MGMKGLFALLILGSVSVSCIGPNRSAEFEALGPLLDGLMDEHGVPGAGLAVFDDRGLLYEHVSGFTSSAGPEPIDSHTAFEAASISKPLFAYVMHSLARDGVLDLDASLDALKRFSNRPCTTWGGRGTSARTDAGGPMRAYSMDLRERALLDSDAGMKAADVAAKYRVSGSWVRLLKQRRRDTGEVAPRVQRQGRRGMLEPHLHTLAALMAAHPDRTRAERKDALATPASVPTVWRAVRALGLTVKNNGPPVRTRSA